MIMILYCVSLIVRALMHYTKVHCNRYCDISFLNRNNKSIRLNERKVKIQRKTRDQKDKLVEKN